MKRRPLILAIVSILILTALPSAALAYDSGGETYNDHDYNAIRAFLEIESSGMKNGVRLNAAYDPDDPTSWGGLAWTDPGDGQLHMQRIEGWNYNRLAGSLDLSDCTALETLYCRDNQLTTLDVSGCPALRNLDCFDNQLTTLDVSGCSALQELNCGMNQLTTLDVSGCPALQDLSCDVSVTVTGDPRNMALIYLPWVFALLILIAITVSVWFISHKAGKDEDWRLAARASTRRMFPFNDPPKAGEKRDPR